MALNESQDPVGTDPALSDLTNQVAALQRQIFSLLLALIVVSGTVTVYLYREASVTRKELDSIRPQAVQIIDTFNKNKPVLANFISQLNTYAQTHPDIEQILARNGFAAPPAAKK
jgi:ABC-type transporter Mla subunit MlaD